LGGVSTATELLIMVGVMHLFALAFVVALIVMMWRNDTSFSHAPPDEDSGEGGGGSPTIRPRPGPWMGDGPPLPYAFPARVRLRAPALLGELIPRPARRPAHAPGVPRRLPIAR
jgi:hypothetical protein